MELEGSGAARSTELLPNGGNELSRSCRNILLYRFWCKLGGEEEVKARAPALCPAGGGSMATHHTQSTHRCP